MDDNTDVEIHGQAKTDNCGHINPEHNQKIADRRVLPLLLVGFAVYQLDRTNIGSVLTGDFARIISVDKNTINLGNQLMFLGVIILEIPSNMVLHKIGARRWIGGQVFIFGLVACLQVFLRNKVGFLVTRSILGLAEAGYIPGAMYTLSTWYDANQLTKRIAIFFFGMFGGTAISPLLGAALLKLEGKGGLFGWQWIFLVEGLFAIVMSIILFYGLPEKRENYPIPKDQESGSLDLPSPDRHRPHISPRLIWETLTNVQKWPHFIATACVFSTWSPLTTYTPSIIMELGFRPIEANALAAIGSLLTLPVIFCFAWMSDVLKKRGLVVLIAISVYLVALVLLRVLQTHVDKWGKFGLWTTVNAFAVGYHPIHNAWIQINCKSAEERSISVAMFVMSATAGLMAGTQIFRGDESSSLYPRGLIIMIALVLSGLLLVVLQIILFRAHNRRMGNAVSGKLGSTYDL